MISKNALVALLALPVAGLATSACLGPTYGTGKSSGEQLFEDVNNLVSFGPSTEKPKIAYTERPDLVVPENTSILPPPQASASAEASDSNETAAFRSGDPAALIPADVATARKEGIALASSSTGRRRVDPAIPLSPAELRRGSELFRERIKARYQGDPARRRYLSEPPVEYRQPAASAPIGDPGIDEDVKEARLKGGGESLGSKIRGLLPF